MLREDGTSRVVEGESLGTAQCGCRATSTSAISLVENETPAAVPERNLEELIPIAVVVAAGCETCAEKAVTRALEHGSSRRHIQKTLDIIAKFQQLDCFAQAVGPEVVARMEKPLAAGRRTLREATVNASK